MTAAIPECQTFVLKDLFYVFPKNPNRFTDIEQIVFLHSSQIILLLGGSPFRIAPEGLSVEFSELLRKICA